KEFVYTITPERIGSWLTTASRDGLTVIDLDRARVDNYLTAIAPKIEVQPRDAKFSLTNGRVNEFQSGQWGYIIDREQTYAALRNALLRDEKIDSIELVIQIIEPKQTTGAVNELGIKELLGVGHSNFAGSPVNRRHNIRTGAKALHGIVIAPGEEFSLLKALGEIDAANGYLPELVIKGNKTVPEFGGGLCQIGTTIFRATMASGLPILERQNHSYSVTYYLENGKPGKDATIYGPKPDYRFRNDTPAHILIQTRIEGDDLYFEFWGTNDGRSQEQTEVKTWGLKKPAPTKIIETEDLPEGKKKCTERPHNGMSAEFTYIVTMQDGTKREQTFRSTYRPWQEVCLLGVPKGSLEKKNAPLESEILPSVDTQ
ncbi:MAG: VanW family protein, partial [Candidatus Yonathbacteria bacterium]|nr:VanW family protein [Candidatus Yonathbacteria bacterium]